MSTGQHTTPDLRSGIYAIRCLVNSRIYVGSAVNILRRWAYHRHHLAKGTHDNSILQRSWNKYGPGQFTFEVLEYVNRCDLIAAEQKYIDAFRAADRQVGFNLRPIAGSALGIRHSAETRAKISAAAKRRQTPEFRARMSAAHKGIRPSLEVRARMSASQRGRRHTPEARARMSIAQMGHRITPDGRARISAAQKGRRPSLEARAKMSATRKGRIHSAETRAKQSAAARRRQTPEYRAKLSAALRGHRKTPEHIAKLVASHMNGQLTPHHQPLPGQMTFRFID